MHALNPASLDFAALSRRLGELAGEERGVEVEFLLHLDVFDERRAYLEAGYASLWDYCLGVLHLREGAAARRIGAMRVLRRFPKLAGALRDGRLCLSTIALLGPILTAESVNEVTAAAAFMTKREVEHLVASRQPRVAPKEGVRKRPERRDDAAPIALTLSPAAVEPGAGARTRDALLGRPCETRPTLESVAAESYSLRVTIDAQLKRDLDALTALLSHKVPTGELGAVLREAIHCAMEKHGRRKGARAPAQERARVGAPPPRAASGRSHVPAHVRREVWRRDGGRCTWVAPDGHRCGSRWRLELDHVVPAALGGDCSADNLRLRCRGHNLLHAEEVFGRAHMARFRRSPAHADESTSPGGSAMALG